MNNEQQAHAEYINDQESKLYLAKYKKGALEHKTKLWEVPTLELLDYAVEEVLDLKSYLFTLRTQLEDLIAENEELKKEIESSKAKPKTCKCCKRLFTSDKCMICNCRDGRR